jgi:imidazolonepropionase
MILIRNIKQLLMTGYEGMKMAAGEEMARLGMLENAWLLTEGEKIASFGLMDEMPQVPAGTKVIDADGRIVMPAFCDSHTHLVYAGSREKEYRDKVMGLSYEEIARRGGGILNSARLLHETSEEELYQQALPRLEEIILQGTGAVEIKSGYGLNTEDELKMLRVIRRLKETSPLTIRATFLGAHAFPAEYRNDHEGYVDQVIHEMIPRVAGEELADFIDVFCDRGFFTPGQTDRILMAGIKYGLKPKIHANELDYSGGVQVGVKYGALSVDHLEFVGEEEIAVLQGSETMPTVLPGASFFLGLEDAPARRMIDAGLPVALASDFNPGSSPTGNMQLMMSLGMIRLRMLPEEVIHAATLNGAYAMGLEEEMGSITPGKTASLIITKPVPGYEYLPYAYGSNHVERMILNGTMIDDRRMMNE